MGQGMKWVWGLVLVGMGCCIGAVCAAESPRPSIPSAESVLADLSWIKNALNERAAWLGQAPLSVPEANDFALMKNYCAGLLPSFVDPTRADSSGDCSAYLDAHGGELPVLEVTEVITRLSLPTNYFDYTPVLWGSAKPSTNAQTAAGGIHFPAGQTVWTEADYGPAGLRRMIGQMVWTKALPYWNGVGGESNVRYTGNEWSESWGACAEYAAANWPEHAYHSNNARPISGTRGYMFSEDCFAFSYVKIWNDLEVSGLPTQQIHSVDFYLKCGLYEDPYYVVSGMFDSQGIPNIRNGYSRIDSTAAGTHDEASVRVGDSGDTLMNWCDMPDVITPTFRGWDAKEVSAVVRWDVPGGLTP
jgi:hypothetical protein